MTMTFEQLQELLTQTVVSLARTEAIVEENSKGVAETRAIADQNTKDIRDTRTIANSNARAVEAMLQQMSMDREERNAVLALIAKQQKQLEGLQTENRRILDLLINNQPEPDDDTE